MAGGRKSPTNVADLSEKALVDGKTVIKRSTGWKYGQYVAAIVATGSLIVSAQNCTWPSGALPKIIDGSAGFNLTDTQKSLLASLPNWGAVLSPIPCSYAMDRYGRKAILSFAIFFAIVAWSVLSLTTNPYLILICRMVMGLWNGTEYITVSIYVAEVVDAKVRGTLISLTCAMFFVGTMYISLISLLSYQAMTMMCVISPVLIFIGFLFIPESPYFYLMHGKRKEAEEAIMWLRGECSSSDLDIVEDAVKQQLLRQGSFKEILSKSSNRKAFFLVECFKVCSSSCLTTLLFSYTPLLLPDAWLTGEQSHIAVCVVWLFSSVLSSSLMYHHKRRTLMMISTVGAIIFLSTAASWYYIRDFTDYDTSSTNWLPLLLVLGTIFFELLGIMNIPNVIKGEIFPINIKTKACALSCMTACGCDALFASLFFFINHHIGMYFHFVRTALTAAMGLFVVVFFMVETKDLTLEKIQEVLNTKKPPKGCHAYELSPLDGTIAKSDNEVVT